MKNRRNHGDPLDPLQKHGTHHSPRKHHSSHDLKFRKSRSIKTFKTKIGFDEEDEGDLKKIMEKDDEAIVKLLQKKKTIFNRGWRFWAKRVHKFNFRRELYH